MGKVAKKLPEEYRQKAIENDLSLTTVYARIKRGWDLDEAVTKPASKIYATNNERIEGEIQKSDRPRSDLFSVRIYQDNEDLFQEAIKKSGKSKSQFVADAVDYYLKNYVKRKRK
jgi:hypothetical protein